MKTPNDYYTAILNALENGESLGAVLEAVGGVISGLEDKSESRLDKKLPRDACQSQHGAHDRATHWTVKENDHAL